MAKAEVKLPEELLTKLSRLGQNTDAVAEKVLQAGGKAGVGYGEYALTA